MLRMFITAAIAFVSFPAAANGPPGGRRGPPPEAFAACKGQTEGAVCQVKTPRGDEVAGKCGAPPQGDSLVCKPDNAPDKGQRRR